MELRSELQQKHKFSILKFATMMQESGAVIKSGGNEVNPIDWVSNRKPIPKYGTVFEIQEFIDDVKQGYIISDDGHGFYADEKGMTSIPVSCDDILSEFSHIVWFGR
jgi:hypothetical protein